MRLVGRGPDLNRDELARIAAGSPLVQRWIWEEQIDSTQRLARERAWEGPGLLVVADEQLGGRGRMGRQWFSPRGQGLWLSIVLSPARPVEEWPLVTSLAGLALRDCLVSAVCLLSGLKWPNDVYCKGRKLAGVLADVVASGPLVLGVGLNVGQAEVDFPSALRDRAISVHMAEVGGATSRPRLLEAFLESLAVWLERFDAGEGGVDGPIHTALREAALLRGRRVRIAKAEDAESLEAAISGRVVDIGPLGELILEPEGAAGQIRVASGMVVACEPPLAEGR